MKKIKSHFWYTKNQRNGILFLLASIIGFQILFHFINFEESMLIAVNHTKIESYQTQLDSLRKISSEDKKFKLYPFNPNYISDFKGYQLGMKTKEIDRLLAHRKKSLFVNSAKEFQMVTKVSDSLLKKIAPHFKFPDWVQKKNQQNKKKRIFNSQSKINHEDISSTNINEATFNDLLSVNGVNEYLADRIIKYRSKLQGFSLTEQLFEVWDLDKETGIKILETFSIVRKPIIVKTNINTASFKEILSNPYIDYDLCLKIFDYKDEVAELQSISEIKNIEGFPLENYTRIVLYLHAE
jgi:DNA uptake protein ComE-like DNA-binding protein